MAVINGTPYDDLDANKLVGTSKADQIFGLGGGDEVVALAGNDLLEGGPGGDYLDGGEGIDTASYVSSASDVWVILNNSTPERDGDAEGDYLTSIENLIGSAYEDSLSGDGLANRIQGGDGGDYISGGGGNDEVEGGKGEDLMAANEGDDKMVGGDGSDVMSAGAGKDESTGGKGADVFWFNDGDSGVTSATRDLIKDFKQSQDDLLYFRGGPFDEDYEFVGKAEFDGTHQARYEHGGGKTIVEVNTDADPDADMTIALTGKINLTAGDFAFHS
jgi:Ca2+-binding RTX toxin-like protein